MKWKNLGVASDRISLQNLHARIELRIDEEIHLFVFSHSLLLFSSFQSNNVLMETRVWRI